MRLVKINRLYVNFFKNRRFLSTMSKALVLLSDGAEEMETVISVDVLRRGEIDVTVAGVHGADPVVCSRNVTLVPDMPLSEAEKNGPYDVIICPGGLKGAQNLQKSSEVGDLLQEQEKKERLIGAICAAPLALMSHNIGSGKTITSHPSVKEQLVKAGYKYSEKRVEQDGKLITSRGPGTTFEFALKIVEILQGAEKRDIIVPPMLLKL